MERKAGFLPSPLVSQSVACTFKISIQEQNTEGKGIFARAGHYFSMGTLRNDYNLDNSAQQNFILK